MINVRRLPRDPGPAGWNEVLPKPPAPNPLNETITADFLVIGAGFAGLAATRRLSQNCPGDRIVLLDAVRVGEGPAGRNSGFMIDLPHDLASETYGGALENDRARIRANRSAIAFAAQMADDLALPVGIFRRAGKINAAATARGARFNAAYARHLTTLDEPFEMLDAAKMQDLTGSHFYRQGLRTPGTAIIQPAAFVRGIAAGLASNRISVHEASPVQNLSRESGSWMAETPSGRVTAARVILAVNGHAESFGFLERRLIHVLTYASMTRSLTAAEVSRLGGTSDWGLTPADPMGTTVRRISDASGDRILIRNTFTHDPTMEVPLARMKGIARVHDRSFARRFPMLADVEMDFRWGGRLCLSRNDVGVVQEVEDGLYLACCQNGLGTVRGTFAGVAAADLATGNETDFTRDVACQPQPTRLPHPLLTRIGAKARLRWSERMAGREL